MSNTPTNISDITGCEERQAPEASENLRNSGIGLIGDIAWGTHVCQFYQTKDDLLDILVPYFRAGLENNELCVWVCWDPLRMQEAKEALGKGFKNLDDCITKGQIEILDYSQWYAKTGRFDANEALEGWVEKEKQAIGRGFKGLRLTGNTFWLEEKDWESFANYEATVNSVIGKHRMLAICSYSLDKCRVSDAIDVVNNHQFALIRKEGKWVFLQSSEHKQAQEALKRSKEVLREEKLLLEQKDLALKELLEHMERTKNKTKEDIGLNVEGLIMPILKKLELKDISRKYTKLLRYHLGELVSSFGRKITAKSTRLSPKETEICSMLKGGLSSKEISELLNVSYQTVDKHRRNIRKKLAISKKKVNLTSFLQKL